MLNIRDFSAQPERFHRALRVIKSFLEEEQEEDELDLSTEIENIDALIEGNAEPMEEDNMGDALLITGPDEEDVLVFFMMYKDEAIAGKLYESQRELLYLDERGIGRKDFVDAVMAIFDPAKPNSAIMNCASKALIWTISACTATAIFTSAWQPCSKTLKKKTRLRISPERMSTGWHFPPVSRDE